MHRVCLGVLQSTHVLQVPSSPGGSAPAGLASSSKLSQSKPAVA